MTRYAVQARDQIFVKDYVFLFFGKNIDKHIGENVSQNLSGKHS